ncbi:PQQ-dependent sugar dehydrogenase [Roseimaritima sediminicola]|uniref:PQQ-dependent sugar dehydrogenase n=1 Tax=Roseimaritima sediminicola TaxID=2662066 RepID=UPI001F1E2A7C|nr:PQQ-dependent sugar dehydrogenase [Roseimaritima sediminicola]
MIFSTRLLAASLPVVVQRAVACTLTLGIVIAGTSLPVGGTAEAADQGSPTINLADPPQSLDVRPMPVKVVEAYPNLRIARPIVLTGAGDDSGRLYIADQYGQVFWIDQDDTEVEEANRVLDIRDRVRYADNENEEGFLGLAFHPQYAQNGQIVVYYTTTKEPHLSVISRFTVPENQRGPDADGKIDPDSEEVLLTIKQPFWNHNGGTVAFGPDGYLYVGLGDGGKANDPLQAGQDLSQLLGSILRIDVDSTQGDKPYGIPADNPFVDREDAQGEIFAYGIRNIWRLAFDPKTNDLWAADVGQNEWEEVNLIRKGGNYGWSLREGGNRFTKNGNGAPPSPELIDPLVEYPHTEDWGKSVTGGAVYRGSRTPILQGMYLYGDYVSGKLWALAYDRQAEKVTANRPIAWQGLPVFTFGQTDDGEVLMSTMMGGGRIYRFEAK